MKRSNFRAMLGELANAWQTRDYDRAVGFFEEDLFYSDSLNYTYCKRSDLLEFFRDDDGLDQFCVFYNALFDEKTQTGAAEYTYIGNSSYHGTVWIKIENNKIVSWREYQHKSDLSWKEFWKNR